jgi:hypothetical protein
MIPKAMKAKFRTTELLLKADSTDELLFSEDNGGSPRGIVVVEVVLEELNCLKHLQSLCE